MARRARLRTLMGEYELVDPWWGAAQLVAPPALVDSRAFVRRCLGDRTNAARLREAANWIEPGRTLDDAWVTHVIGSALRTGRLRLVARVRPRAPLEFTEASADLSGLAGPPPTRRTEPLPTWVEVQVLYADGRPYPGLAVTVATPDGGQHKLTLDDKSICRVDEIESSGSCVVHFDDGVPLPAVEDEPVSQVVDGSVVQRPEPISPRVATANKHVVVVEQAVVPVLRWDGERTIESAARLIEAVRTRADTEIVVVGHGEADEARANSVHLFLANDADGWSSHNADTAPDDEAQRVLLWAANRNGWACDPGPIDGDFGKRSRSALRAFRRRAHIATGSTGGSGDSMSADDWALVFELLEIAFEERLGEDPANAWDELAFAEPPVVAGGDDGDERVDVLLFRVDDLPPDLADAAAACEAIYDETLYVHERIDVDGDEPHCGVCFEFTIPVDEGQPFRPGATLCLESEDHELPISFEDAESDEPGWLCFRFYGIHEDAEYAMVYSDDESDAVEVFESRPLNGFIDCIGQPDDEVEAIDIVALPFLGDEEEDDDVGDDDVAELAELLE